MKWIWKNKRDSSAWQMNKWNWSSMRQRGLVHYGGILSLTHSDSLRFRLTLPCRNMDLRVCCPVDWKLREHSFDIKHTPSFAKISTDRESCIRERKTESYWKYSHSFIYLLSECLTVQQGSITLLIIKLRGAVSNGARVNGKWDKEGLGWHSCRALNGSLL